MTLIQNLKWFDVRAGAEYAIKFSDGKSRRAIVVADGLWRRSPVENEDGITCTTAVCKDDDEKLYMYERSNSGRFLAVAYAAGSSWRAVFVSKTRVVSTWADEQARITEKEKKEAAALRNLELKRISFNAAAAVVATQLGGIEQSKTSQLFSSYKLTAEMEKAGLAFNTYDRSIIVKEPLLGKLTHLLESQDTSEATARHNASQAVIKSLRQENDELRKRAEAAEERIAALKFVLNS